MAKSRSTSRGAGRGGSGGAATKPARTGRAGASDEAGGAPTGARSGSGKQLVIVESPAKAKTINKYLGGDYTVLASVGHVRDLPSKNPKGVKSPVPGVDLEHDFRPTYEVMEKKGKVISDLKRAARGAREVWFATDPDREGEAIAWHVAEELGIDPRAAKRVMFAEITKSEIQRAFGNPHPINMDRVNAQQARRVLDRIVGYQVSPLLWKKVARGLSAGRVQSVAVRLIVEREREIRAFVPDESWEITANFTPEMAKAAGLAEAWRAELGKRNEKGEAPTQRALSAWLGEHGAFGATLVEVGGEKFEVAGKNGEVNEALAERARAIAAAAGLKGVSLSVREDAKGKGPARFVRTLTGTIDPATPYRVTGIETKRTSSRPAPPFITSTLQQAGANRLGMSAKHTMAAAQQLYQGVEIPGEGPVALITYMRTDSTHLSNDALSMVRGFIDQQYGAKYLPEKPNFYTSSNKDAQEAHEAIRPTSMAYPPAKLRSVLKPDLWKVYNLIWNRFVACQMTPAQWDATAVTIVGGADPKVPLAFRATGRVLVFDGFYRATGVPLSAEEQQLPALRESQPVAALAIEPRQRFTSPPPRYTEASLIKTLEAEGIGRPSTYASIISVIQDRQYVEQVDRRFYATDLGEVVTKMLMEAFPDLMDLGYTREMESDLDKVEEDHLDWVQMLKRFYGPFQKRLGEVEGTLKHAKAETTPAPADIRCPTCGSGMVYRLGKSGKFLSCATYPKCSYACPVDREGRPRPVQHTNVACHKCGRPMTKRTGRFGAFLGCSGYGDKANPCDGILRLDKKGQVQAPSTPPYVPDPAQPCPKCESPMNLRPGKYGPWLGCSKFPKCRGRGNFKGLPEAEQKKLMAALEAWEAAHPVPIIKTVDGRPLTDAKGKPLPDAPKVDGSEGESGGAGKSLEAVADELGV
ncbi:MAG: type I DNA topoisomerase [Phycisphaerae bacterium]|nr:type I DNA topoisomerase [Phycisphaerae bacterium]